MDFFRFIGWWWNKLESSSKALSVIFVSFASLCIAIPLIGPVAILIYVCLVATLLLILATYHIYLYFRNHWIIWKAEIAREQELIVRKLKGRT